MVMRPKLPAARGVQIQSGSEAHSGQQGEEFVGRNLQDVRLGGTSSPIGSRRNHAAGGDFLDGIWDIGEWRLGTHSERILSEAEVLGAEYIGRVAAGGNAMSKQTSTKKKGKENSKHITTVHDRSLRQHLLDLLAGGSAHAKFEDVIRDYPVELRGKKPDGLPHSPWMLLEHLRIAQWDILEFSRNAKYVSPAWPAGYWPATEAPPSGTAWDESLRQFRRDFKAMQRLVANPKSDLFARIPWGDGQTVLREALLLADHNAYHLAQLVDARRLLGAWKD
jgi:hypothetical protein